METRVLRVHISLFREHQKPDWKTCFGAMLPQGDEGFLEPILLAGQEDVEQPKTPWLRFDVSLHEPHTTGEVLKTATAEIQDGAFLMRLDQVTFPPGAVAYRHVHSGAGIRYLDQGHLTLQSDDHSFEALVGESWFEPANTPVRATASLNVAQSRFKRFMVLPLDFAGKPTINILDPQDVKRPKKQTTHRFFEQVVHLDAG